MELDELKQRMRKSIERFLKDEADLLKQGANEESITTQLKKCLELEFSNWDWDVDHQYDKRIIENEVVQKRTMFARRFLPKKKIPKSIRKDLEIINKRIMPDIIFHDRHSNKHNFLVIEVKLSTNKNKDDLLLGGVGPD